MTSELVHSRPLSRRFKRDGEFRFLLKKNNDYKELETGVKQAICLNENESLFSKFSGFDSEDEFEKYAAQFSDAEVLSNVKLAVERYRVSQALLTKKRLKKVK